MENLEKLEIPTILFTEAQPVEGSASGCSGDGGQVHEIQEGMSEYVVD